jgi:hypothetical protein
MTITAMTITAMTITAMTITAMGQPFRTRRTRRRGRSCG